MSPSARSATTSAGPWRTSPRVCSARTSPQNADKTQQANTLAGLHADYIMFVLDESGGMPLMRVRIREGSRFTVFDIDPGSAERWGRAMVEWSQTQEKPA